MLEAESLLERENYQLLLLSIEKSDQSSCIEFIQRLKKRSPPLQVIIITSKKRFDAFIECSEIGGDDYLTYPLEFTNVVNIVNRTVELRKKEEQAIPPEKCNPNARYIAQYEVKGVLGSGSMGIVYLAHKVIDGVPKNYALKILSKPESFNEESVRELLERFLREAEAAAGLRHPKIVGIVDYGISEDDHTPYIVMDLVRGRSLRYYINNPIQLGYTEKVRIIREVAHGLTVIHLHGICHRDIKPENIMLDENLNVKITDFGIARMPNSDLTQTMKVLGTPAYMAPEAFSSSKIEATADIFSLGVVAYELFLGMRPFQGDSIDALRNAIRKERPLHPHKIDIDFPDNLIHLLVKMLRKKPAERYQSAGDIVVELDDYWQLRTNPGRTEKAAIKEDGQKSPLVELPTPDNGDSWK